MKEITNILYIGQHEEIRATVLRLLGQQENWCGTAVSCVADALPLLQDKQWDIILLGNGVPEAEEQQLRSQVQGHTKVLQHYGGGSGLLFGEIWEALLSR